MSLLPLLCACLGLLLIARLRWGWLFILLHWVLNQSHAVRPAHKGSGETERETLDGPPITSIDGHLRDKFVNGRQRSKEWRASYGHIYRIWAGTAPEIVITTSSDARIFHSGSVHSKAAACNAGWLFDALLGRCLGMLNGTRWKQVRGLFEPTFSPKGISNHTVGAAAETFIARLHAEHIGALDAARLSYFPFFVTAELLYGKLDAAQRAELWHVGLKRTALMRFVVEGGQHRYGWFRWMASRARRELAHFQEQWLSFNTTIYQERSAWEVPFARLWADVVQGTATQNEVRLTSGLAAHKLTEQILQTFDEMLFANLDVTTHVLTWLLVHLAQHRDSQSAVRKELLDDVAGGDGHGVDWAPLLDRCLLESMRLQPITVFTIPEAASEWKVLSGFAVPPGSDVVIDALALNTEPRVWGDDALSFRPGRWLQQELTTSKLRYSFFAFGLGNRKCLGATLARKMIKALVAQLLLRYELTLADNEERSETGKADVVTTSSWVPITALQIQLHKIKELDG